MSSSARPQRIHRRDVSVRWVTGSDDPDQACRLRHWQLGGGRLRLADAATRDDAQLDRQSLHLVIGCHLRQQGPWVDLASCRVLAPIDGRTPAELPADRVFRLDRLSRHRSRLIEIDRMCLAPGADTHSVMAVLGCAIGDLLRANRLFAAIWRLPLPSRDGGHASLLLWHWLRARWPDRVEARISPWVGLPATQLARQIQVRPPAALEPALRSRFTVAGPPGWHLAEHTAELPLLLRAVVAPGLEPGHQTSDSDFDRHRPDTTRSCLD